jgi:chromosome segregation ATPase
MVEQTDAEFLADIAAKAEQATADIEENWSISPALSNLMGEAAIVIPRLIAMVEERERERDESIAEIVKQRDRANRQYDFANEARQETLKVARERDEALREVDAEKKRADDSDAALAMANSLYAERPNAPTWDEIGALQNRAEKAEANFTYLQSEILASFSDGKRDIARFNALLGSLRAWKSPITKAEAERNTCIKEVARIGVDLGRSQAKHDAALREMERLRAALETIRDQTTG